MLKTLLVIVGLAVVGQSLILPLFSWHLNFLLWPAAVLALVLAQPQFFQLAGWLALFSFWFDWQAGATPGWLTVALWLVLTLIWLVQKQLRTADWPVLIIWPVAIAFYFLFQFVFSEGQGLNDQLTFWAKGEENKAGIWFQLGGREAITLLLNWSAWGWLGGWTALTLFLTHYFHGQKNI